MRPVMLRFLSFHEAQGLTSLVDLIALNIEIDEIEVPQ